MKQNHAMAMMLVAACPLLMAPAGVGGSLGGFSQGTPGGQSAASWGLPQSSSGQTSGQGPSQGAPSSSQSSGQSAPSSAQGSTAQNPTSQNSTPDATSTPSIHDRVQDPKGEPNESDNSTQDPKGEPNESDHSTQDPKGEPNESDNSTQDPKGEPNEPDSDYPPLDSSDGQYDPANSGDDNQIPSDCAEAGSECAQCVRDAEANIQFNRRYLHTAWAISNSTIEYANKKIAFGDSVSGIHGVMALSWQLAGKPQIEEALADLRKTYGRKYRDYTGHIERSLQKMANCEEENFATRDLYQRFGFLYLEFIRSRYESPD